MMMPLLPGLILAAALTGAAALLLRGRVRRADRPVAAAFLVALALAGFFGFRAVDRAVFWMDTDHHRMPPEPWMTLGFIERSWDLPPRSLRDVVLPAGDDGPRHRPLARIARDRGVPVEQVIADISAVLASGEHAPDRTP